MPTSYSSSSKPLRQKHKSTTNNNYYRYNNTVKDYARLIYSRMHVMDGGFHEYIFQTYVKS